ncbi:MAG TPA: tetratricopeptide repeat protein [Candidatus Kapabacteria bacterium]
MEAIDQAKRELEKAHSEKERLRLLLEKSIQCYRNYPKEARKWAIEALKLARKLKNNVDEARAHLRLGCASFQLCEYERAAKDANLSIEILDATDPNSQSKGSAHLLLGMALSEMGQLRQAMAQYEIALKLCASNPTKRIEVLNEMANVFLALSNYPKALECQYESLSILDQFEDPIRRSFVISSIGSIYLAVQNHEKANSFFQQGFLIAKEVLDYSTQKEILYNRGLIAQRQSDFLQARKFFLDALELSRRLGKPDSDAYVSQSLGEMALEAGKPREALRFFKEALGSAKAIKLASVWSAALLGLGKTYVALDQYEEGISSIRDALQRSEEHGMKELECECAGALATAYEADGKLKEAVQYFNRHIGLSGELHSHQRQRAIVEISARVEIEKADRERARMEKLALDANERAELLRVETERQSDELTQLALHLVQKNEFLCDLKSEMAPAIKKSKKLQSIVERIDDHIKSDRDWETFEHQFNQVHREFLAHLSVEYPALTPAELKIAVMMKLNLPTKAIANLFCLSIRTVENHRQSIRRKLSLGAESNLVSFLTSIGEAK